MQLLYMLTYPAVIFQWFVDATSADAAVCKKIIIEEVLEVRPEKGTPPCLKPQVCVDVCRKCFNKDAWLVLKDVISTIKEIQNGIVEDVLNKLMTILNHQSNVTVVCYGFILNALLATQNQSIKFGFAHVV